MNYKSPQQSAFSGNSLYTIPGTCEIPHAFGFPIVNTHPCLQNSIIVNPLPFGNPWYRYGYFLESPNYGKYF